MNIILEFPLLDGDIHYVDFTIMAEFLTFIDIEPIEFIICYVSRFLAKDGCVPNYSNIESWLMDEMNDYFDMYISACENGRGILSLRTNQILAYMRSVLTGDSPTELKWADLDEVFNSIVTVLQHHYSEIVLPNLHRNHLEVLSVERLNERFVIVSVGETFTVESAKLYGIKGVRHGHYIPLSALSIS